MLWSVLPVGAECGVDQEVYATAGQEAGATCSCCDRQPWIKREIHSMPKIEILYRWLISEAMQAAPKPLSMLTTETLGEQVFNMPRSAATPPNEAP